VCGIFGLIHFVYALSTAPLKFPSFTFLTHLVSPLQAIPADHPQMALVLFTVIAFSILIKALTHLFTIGHLPSPILVNILPHEGVIPSIEDDFSVALLKLGTACIEATQYSGLRNELVGISAKQGPWVEISGSGSDVFRSSRTSGGFGVEITDIEVSELADPHMEKPYWKELKAFGRACRNTLAMYSWSLLMAVPGGLKLWNAAKFTYQNRWYWGPRQIRFWRREAWREPPHLRQRAVLRRLEDIARLRNMAIERYSQDASIGVSTAVQLRQTTPAPIEYAQILSGEIEIEDDEEDWQDEADDSSSASSSASDGEEGQALYRDLIAPTEPEDDLQPVLLAHLTSRSSTPLTRRQYATLLVGLSRSLTPQNGLQDVIQDRRVTIQGKNQDEWDEDRRRCCVVCTIEPRDTILWPCR